MTTKTDSDALPLSAEDLAIEHRLSRISRAIEVYIFICFVLIIIFPVMEGDWVQPTVRFLYFTGFPLLILLIISSFAKNSLITLMKKFQSPPANKDS